MNVSIEYITTNVYLCRWHPEGHFGDPYIASCVIHYIDHLPYVKGLTIKQGEITPSLVKDLKEKIGVEKLYFERMDKKRRKL